MKPTPNILYLLNDHQAYYRHGWDGGPQIKRPCFDRLAAGGICFNRAYSSSPLCGPVRRTMLTGLFPHNHGELHNDTNHPFDRETYLTLLADSGYRNYYYGKWHAGPGTALEHQCEGFSYPSYNNPYTKPEYKAYREQHGLPEPAIDVERVFQQWDNKHLAVHNRYRQEAEWCNEHASGIMTTPNETHEAFFLAHLACEQLKKIAAAEDQQPFHLRVDFWGPHQPYFPTREYADMYTPEAIPEYPSFRDRLENKPDIYRFEANNPLNKDRELIIPNPLPWPEWQTVVARCYAQITLTDAAGGVILATLEELGLADNTLVIWTTDHGDALACHGGHFDKDSYMPEEMLRIPCAMRLPGRIPAGQVCEELVGSIDFAPTMLDAAGTAFTGPVDGQSLLPLACGRTKSWREDIVCETHGHCLDHVGRAIITDRYKYTANGPELDELYDLVEDPYEMNNLVLSPACTGILQDMQGRLRQWQEATGDTAEVIAT
jgi:arylsulfatase A-like enzyme